MCVPFGFVCSVPCIATLRESEAGDQQGDEEAPSEEGAVDAVEARLVFTSGTTARQGPVRRAASHRGVSPAARGQARPAGGWCCSSQSKGIPRWEPASV